MQIVGNRKDLENSLFQRWLVEKDNRVGIEKSLQEILYQHAQAVVYLVLRKADPGIITECVNRVLLSLSSFKGDSLFTTWAHRIMLGVVYDARRADRRRREVPLDFAMNLGIEGDRRCSDLLLSIKQTLSNEEYVIFEQIALLGKTKIEAAEYFGIPETTLWDQWKKIIGKLSCL